MSESGTDDTVDAEVVEDSAAIVPASPPATPVPGFAPDLPAAPATDYTNDGVPTFDYVRDQIEKRVATSIGSAELAGATPEAESVDDQFAKREQAGKDRLEAIRRSMRGE